MSELTTIIDTDELRMTYSAGTTGTAIVSFTGIQQRLGGIQHGEFARTLDEQDATHSVYYVTDKIRSWYNRTRNDILRHLVPHLADVDRVITLGNSMGGFGAIYFSGLLPRCRRAVAFVPQYSVTNDTPDPRWLDWRHSITQWTVLNALENVTDLAPAVVIFGANNVHDQWHIDAMRSRLDQPHKVIVIEGAGHDAGRALKSRDVLTPIIAAAIAGAPGDDIERAIGAAGFGLC